MSGLPRKRAFGIRRGAPRAFLPRRPRRQTRMDRRPRNEAIDMLNCEQ